MTKKNKPKTIDEILKRFDKEIKRHFSYYEQDLKDVGIMPSDAEESFVYNLTDFIRKEIEELLEGLRMEEKKPPEYNTMAGVDRDTARAESKVWGYNQAVKELNTKINKALGKEEK